MNRPKFAAAVLATVLTVGLTTAGTAVAAPAKSSPLRSRLLSLSDLPTGWAVTNKPGGGGGLSKSPCLSKLHKAPKGGQTATVSFDSNGTLPLLGETLKTLPNKAALKAWAAASKALAGCKTLSLTDNGKTIHGTSGAMSFPKEGSASSA